MIVNIILNVTDSKKNNNNRLLSLDFPNGPTNQLDGSSGVSGYAQKLDNTFQSFAGGVARITNRGFINEPARQNFIAYSSDLNNAGWSITNSFTGKTARTSIIPGQTAYEFESNTTAGTLNQNSRGTFTGGVETLSVLVEALPSSTITQVSMCDSSAGNVEVISMIFNFATKVITQRGNATSKKFSYIDYGPSSGPFGGNLYRLILSGIPTVPGNTRRQFIYPNGASASTAGRKTIFHHVQYEIGSYATSPIVNTGTTSNTRAAEASKISFPTGTYDARYVTQNGTVIDKYGVSSVSNLLTIATDITQNVPIQTDDATLQNILSTGYINTISIWEQAAKDIHVLGDSYATSTNPYIIPKWLPVRMNRPRVWTFDGVGGSTLAEQATRFDSTPQHYGKVLVIMDGGLDSTFAQAKAAIDSMVAHLTGTKQWIYVQPGIDATPGNEVGSSYQNNWVAVQNALEVEYPNNFVRTRSLMQTFNDGSANDLADIANGWWGRSRRLDTIHPNNLGSYNYAGIVIDELIVKGF